MWRPADEQFHTIDPDFNLNIDNNNCRYFTIDGFNSNFGNDAEKYLLFNQNLQSFHAKKNIFEGFLDSINASFHTMVLTETWNESHTLGLCKIDNFSPIHSHREIRRSPHGGIGGGVSIFANTSIYDIKKINHLSFINENIETCVARISRKDNNDLEHYIVGVYRPRHDDDEIFINILHNILSNEIFNNKTIILAGDMNIDLLNHNDSFVNLYSCMLNSLNFVQAINKATRFPNGNNPNYNPSCLDHIYINKFIPFTAPIFFADISDHCGTAFHATISPTPIAQRYHKITFRLINEENMNIFESTIAQINWNFIEVIEDVDEQFNTFQNYVNNVFQHCFPLKTKFISDKRKRKPWITEETMAKIKQKSEYYKQYRNGLITKEENNRLKNRLNKEINRDKSNYYQSIFTNSKHNSKKSWKTLHSLLGTSGNKSSADKIFTELTTDTDKLATVNKVNEFFASIGSHLAEQLPDSILSPTFPSDFMHHNFYLFPPTLEEVTKIIMNLKITWTPVDTLPVKLLKKFCNFFVVPITLMINNSIQKGVFPSELKIARITPIHKEGSFNDPSNFRPISSLSYLSKTYEKFFSQRLIKFCNKYSLISSKQFGFQHGKSTTDALVSLTEDIYSALDNHLHYLAAIIDVKKAFDCVNHSILISKLQRYGVRGIPLKWLTSYLSDRRCYVELGTFKSNLKTFNMGVPQGSILGPTLFLIYVNNLTKFSDILQTQLFADDTIVYNRGTSIDTLTSSTNEELSKLKDWTLANKLTIHAGKTKLLMISNRIPSHQSISIKIMDKEIFPSLSCKYLGIYLDHKLTFKEHIQYINSKISRNTGILYKIREYLPLKARLDYYYAYIYPYLTYNTIIWGGTYLTHLQPIILQQKRTIRTIANAGFLDHTDPLFKKFRLLKFQDIYKFQLGTYMFHAKKRGEYPTQTNVHTRSRGANLARSVFHGLTSTQHAVSYAGPTFWNKLPPSLRTIKSFSRFKKSLKDYLLDNY